METIHIINRLRELDYELRGLKEFIVRIPNDKYNHYTVRISRGSYEYELVTSGSKLRAGVLFAQWIESEIKAKEIEYKDLVKQLYEEVE